MFKFVTIILCQIIVAALHCNVSEIEHYDIVKAFRNSIEISLSLRGYIFATLLHSVSAIWGQINSNTM